MKIVNFGSLNIDFTFHVERIAEPGQTIDSVKESRFPGGKGLNQSLALARAGMPVYHAGLIGEDGAFLRDILQRDGVDCSFVSTTDIGTGKAFIQVGANRANTRAYCDEVLSAFAAGDMILLQNEINCIDYLIDRAYEKGMRIVLNPSPMNEKVLSCDLAKVSVFIMNEDEGSKITGQTDVEGILSEMGQRYPESKVILTLGGKGAVYAFGEERIFQDAFPVEAVDTTGAGDTFTGYMLAHMLRGDETGESLRRAAKAAAIAVTRRGAASAIPYASEL